MTQKYDSSECLRCNKSLCCELKVKVISVKMCHREVLEKCRSRIIENRSRREEWWRQGDIGSVSR